MERSLVGWVRILSERGRREEEVSEGGVVVRWCRVLSVRRVICVVSRVGAWEGLEGRNFV